MKSATILIAALAGLTAASPTYRAESARSEPEGSTNYCFECAGQCGDPTLESTYRSVCYILKCGPLVRDLLHFILNTEG